MSEVIIDNFQRWLGVNKEDLREQLRPYSMEKTVDFLEKEINIIAEELDKANEVVNNASEDEVYSYNYKRAVYIIKMCQRKINFLKSILNFAIYARIQNISPMGIYKMQKEEIKELEAEFEAIQAEANQEIQKRIDLRKNITDKKESLQGLEAENQERVNEEIAELQKILDSRYTGPYNAISNIKEEAAKLHRKLDSIRGKNSHDYTSALASNIENYKYLQGLEQDALAKKIKSDILLLGGVGADYDKSIAMARLLIRYKNISDNINSPKYRIVMKSGYLPEALRESLKGVAQNKSSGELIVENGREALDVFTNYKKKCLELKEIVESEYTVEKFNIIFANKSCSNVIKMVELHKDKIKKETISRFNELISMRDKELKNKALIDSVCSIFPFLKNTESYKMDIINSIENQIAELWSDMYKDVYSWYVDNGTEVSKYFKDFYTPFSIMDPTYTVQESVLEWQRQLDEWDKLLVQYEKMFNDCLAGMDKNMELLKKNKEEVEKKIKELGNLKQVVIPTHFSSESEALEEMQNAYFKIYKIETTKQILQYAKYIGEMEVAQMNGAPISRFMERRIGYGELDESFGLGESKSTHSL